MTSKLGEGRLKGQPQTIQRAGQARGLPQGRDSHRQRPARPVAGVEALDQGMDETGE